MEIANNLKYSNIVRMCIHLINHQKVLVIIIIKWGRENYKIYKIFLIHFSLKYRYEENLIHRNSKIIKKFMAIAGKI